MHLRILGKSGIAVSAIGFGCMGLSEFYGPLPEDTARAVLRRAVDRGITHFDTADMYGRGASEELIGSELASIRDEIVIATKCGIVRHDSGRVLDGSPGHIRRACEASLRRLRTTHVDLLYLHRIDPATPIEATVAAMGALVQEGKVRCIGLSKTDAATLARADAVFPIAAVQMEYSLWHRDVERDLMALCVERNIALVAYSPLSRGALSGRVRPPAELHATDHRRRLALFDGGGSPAALATLNTLNELAASERCTLPQLALAWLLAKGRMILPIPGMRSAAHVDDNAKSVDLRLTAEGLAAIETASAAWPLA